MEQFYFFGMFALLLLIAGNYLLTFALIRKVGSSGVKMMDIGLPVGTTAPQFKAQTLDGRTVSNADFASKNFLFIFISPHCTPCRQSLRKYLDLIPVAHQYGVEIQLVSIGNLEDTQALAEEFQIEKRVIIVAPNENNPLTNEFRASVTPSYCFVDDKGIIRSTGYPGSEEHDWMELTNRWSIHLKEA